MSRLSYLGKQFAVCAIDDFVNVKVSIYEIVQRTDKKQLKRLGYCVHNVCM